MPAEECPRTARPARSGWSSSPASRALVERVQSERLGLGPAARFLVAALSTDRVRGAHLAARIAGPVRTRRPKVLDERLRAAAPSRGSPRAAAKIQPPGLGSSALRTASPRAAATTAGRAAPPATALSTPPPALGRRESGDALERGRGERLRVDRRAFRAGAILSGEAGAVSDGRGDILILFTTRADGLRRDRRLAVHKTSNDEAARRLRRVRRQQGPRVYGPSLYAPLSDRPRRSAVEGHLLALPQREGHRRRSSSSTTLNAPSAAAAADPKPSVDGACAAASALVAPASSPSAARRNSATTAPGSRGKPRLDGGRHIRTDCVVRGRQAAPSSAPAVEALVLQPDAPQELGASRPAKNH